MAGEEPTSRLVLRSLSESVVVVGPADIAFPTAEVDDGSLVGEVLL